MPISTADFISTQSKTAVQFKLEQTYILFNSLMMLNKADENLSYNSWLAETAVSIAAEQRHTNLVITDVLPAGAVPSALATCAVAPWAPDLAHCSAAALAQLAGSQSPAAA